MIAIPSGDSSGIIYSSSIPPERVTPGKGRIPHQPGSGFFKPAERLCLSAKSFRRPAKLKANLFCRSASLQNHFESLQRPFVSLICREANLFCRKSNLQWNKTNLQSDKANLFYDGSNLQWIKANLLCHGTGLFCGKADLQNRIADLLNHTVNRKFVFAQDIRASENRVARKADSFCNSLCFNRFDNG